MRDDKRPQYCYQVQDFTMPLPKQLEDMHATSNIDNSREALVLVVHVLMTEVDFQANGWRERLTDNSVVEHSVQETLSWRQPQNVLELNYTHPTCLEASFTVVFIALGPNNLVLHGLVSADEESDGFSLGLRISDFVQKTFLSDPEPNKVYRNLPTLSRTVKDGISLPLLGWAQSGRCLTGFFRIETLKYWHIFVQTVCNVLPTFGFLTLSSEIQLLILGYLSVRDLLAASRVNVDLYHLTAHPALWRKLFLKHFPSVELSLTEEVVDWRERYKREYLQRKEHRECAVRLLPPPPALLRPRPFVPPPMPFLDEFDQRGIFPRLPRFLPPHIPEIPRILPDPAFLRPHFNRFGLPPHQRLGPGFDFL